MLRIVIVDDERFIREGLRTLIMQSGLSLNVAGEAKNGEDACRLIEQTTPDLVITDVKMPKMDGIALIKWMNQHYPRIHAIALSGYDDYPLVRETFRNGVLDYIVKPINKKQLFDLLQAALDQMESEQAREQQDLALKFKLNQSMPLLRQRFLKRLVSGKVNQTGVLQERLNDFEIDPDEAPYQVCIVQINNYPYLSSVHGEEEAKLYEFMIENIMSETLGGLGSCSVFQDEAGCVAAILGSPKQDIRQQGEERISLLYRNLEKHIKIRFTIAAGNGVNQLSNVSQSYLQAKQHLKSAFYGDGSQFVSEAPAFSAHEVPLLDETFEKVIHQLQDHVILSNTVSILSELQSLSNQLETYYMEPEMIIPQYALLVNRMTWNHPSILKTVYQLYGADFSFEHRIRLFDTLDEITKYTFEFLSTVAKHHRHSAEIRDVHIIDQAKRFVKEHYNEELTLSRVADIVHVSAAYLSEMFAKETDENFVEYVTRIRMTEAKRLLKDYSMKTYEIAERIGYPDASYFSKVFKKQVGVSPSDYRQVVMH